MAEQSSHAQPAGNDPTTASPEYDEHGATIGNVLHADTDETASDSAYGEEGGSLTTSISSSIYDYRRENGRTYHAYKDGQYVYPNDETEQDRLDLQHHLYLLSFGNKLALAPLPDKLHNVLDLGTGTGLWAIDFADEHPEAQVLGTDLSPIQPTSVPPNCAFEVDDANEEWTYSRKFDYIHVRLHHVSIKEDHLYAMSLKFLVPGGWFEHQELSFPCGCDDGTLSEDSALYKWSQLMLEGSTKFGQPLDNSSKYGDWMKKAGFENVNHTVFKFPGNDWPKGKQLKNRGLWMMQNHLDGLHGFTMGLFTRALGWSPEEVEVFLVDVRKDITNRKIHVWWPVNVVYGQKPLDWKE